MTKLKQPSNTGQIANLFALLDRSAKTLVTIVGVCYGTGLMITHGYLAQYGVADFAAFRAQYIVTGACFWVVVALPGLLLYFPAVVAKRIPWKFTGRILSALSRSIAYIAILILLFELVLMVSTVAFPLHASTFSGTLYAIIQFYGSDTLALFLVYLGVVMSMPSRVVPGVAKEVSRFYILVGCTCALVALGFYGSYYINGSYTRLSPSLGGGQPEIVRLLFTEPPDGSTVNRGLKPDSADGSVVAELIYESADAYFLLSPDIASGAKCIRLPKSLTEGLIYLKRTSAAESSNHSVAVDTLTSDVVRDSGATPLESADSTGG